MTLRIARPSIPVHPQSLRNAISFAACGMDAFLLRSLSPSAATRLENAFASEEKRGAAEGLWILWVSSDAEGRT